MAIDDEVRTYQIGLESTRNGITVSIPWAQRQANGAVIVRLHIQSPRHQAGELLLNETDIIALDPEERPLRTQVRRVWGYASLGDVTRAHLQTARFDAGFRLDIAATRGYCGLAIALLRTFRPNEGPRTVGGPWVFKFRVADDAEVAQAIRAEAARQQAAREEAARQEAARQEAGRAAAERQAALQAARAGGDGQALDLRIEQRQAALAGGDRRTEELHQNGHAEEVLATSGMDTHAPAQEPGRSAAGGLRTRRGRRFLRPEREAAEAEEAEEDAALPAEAAATPATQPEQGEEAATAAVTGGTSARSATARRTTRRRAAAAGEASAAVQEAPGAETPPAAPTTETAQQTPTRRRTRGRAASTPPATDGDATDGPPSA
jgi:hypothetical protein